MNNLAVDTYFKIAARRVRGPGKVRGVIEVAKLIRITIEALTFLSIGDGLVVHILRYEWEENPNVIIRIDLHTFIARPRMTRRAVAEAVAAVTAPPSPAMIPTELNLVAPGHRPGRSLPELVAAGVQIFPDEV